MEAPSLISTDNLEVKPEDITSETMMEEPTGLIKLSNEPMELSIVRVIRDFLKKEIQEFTEDLKVLDPPLHVYGNIVAEAALTTPVPKLIRALGFSDKGRVYDQPLIHLTYMALKTITLAERIFYDQYLLMTAQFLLITTKNTPEGTLVYTLDPDLQSDIFNRIKMMEPITSLTHEEYQMGDATVDALQGFRVVLSQLYQEIILKEENFHTLTKSDQENIIRQCLHPIFRRNRRTVH